MRAAEQSRPILWLLGAKSLCTLVVEQFSETTGQAHASHSSKGKRENRGKITCSTSTISERAKNRRVRGDNNNNNNNNNNRRGRRRRRRRRRRSNNSNSSSSNSSSSNSNSSNSSLLDNKQHTGNRWGR